MGLAGANVARQCRCASARGCRFARLRIETDAVIAVEGRAGRRATAIVAALGTGSVFAVQRAGVIRQIGGWGLVLGDEGSGAWIGRRSLSRDACGRSTASSRMTPLIKRA